MSVVLSHQVRSSTPAQEVREESEIVGHLEPEQLEVGCTLNLHRDAGGEAAALSVDPMLNLECCGDAVPPMSLGTGAAVCP